jgi:hypothetical protein
MTLSTRATSTWPGYGGPSIRCSGSREGTIFAPIVGRLDHPTIRNVSGSTVCNPACGGHRTSTSPNGKPNDWVGFLRG